MSERICDIWTHTEMGTYCVVSKKFHVIDGIGRHHISCGRCGRNICLLRAIDNYQEGQEIIVGEHGGEVSSG